MRSEQELIDALETGLIHPQFGDKPYGMTVKEMNIYLKALFKDMLEYIRATQDIKPTA